MYHARKILSALVLVVLVQIVQASLVCAQALTAPLWDRKAEGIIIRPLSGSGGKRSSIQAMLRVSAQPTSVPLDLSTLVEIVVNGRTIDVLELAIKADPTGAAGCTTPCHEHGQVCVCVQGLLCGCGTILINTPPVNASLDPEDEISIILTPAPDAQPELSDGNDKRKLRWNGRPTVWERNLASIEKKPSASLRGGTDVQVEVGAIANHEGELNLDTDLELRVNGKPVAQGHSDFDDYVWASCSGACEGSVCASLNQGDAGAACQKDPEVGNDTCWCNFPSLGKHVFKGVKLAPDDEISVVLLPAPGALPDMPRPVETKPVPKVEFRRGDSSGNGKVEMADAIFTLGWQFLGSKAPRCQDAADVNDDGEVNIGDPIFLLTWLFLGGVAPPAPGPTKCGEDPTADRLPECEANVCALTF